MERSPRARRSGGSGGGGSSSRRRRAEMVDTDGMWCCIVRRPPAATIRGGNGGAGAGDGDWRRRERFAAEDGEKGTEILLQSKELESLIKRGIAGGTGIVVERSSKGSPFRLRLSPGRVSPISDASSAIVPTSTAAAANGGGTSPKSPGKLLVTPPSPPADKQHMTRASPTLLEMMSLEHENNKHLQLQQQQHLQQLQLQQQQQQLQGLVLSLPSRPPSVQEKVDAILLLKSPGNCFNDSSSSDVKLTLTGKDGFSISINVHRHILTSQSRFFAAKFSDWWSKQHRSPLNAVEISDCDDVDLYLQTIRLMYCRDLKRSLIKESVSRVLGILKVSAAILFEAGVISCLEYLEAMPWPEDEEEKVTSLISQLQLDNVAAMGVLKRLSIIDTVEPEGVITRLLQSVIQGTDDKARRETKAIVSKMLRENASRGRDMGESCRDCFYRACEVCLNALLDSFALVTSNAEKNGTLAGHISRQADNLNWMVDILIDRQIAERFTQVWAQQFTLAKLYSQTPAVYRYDVSRVTARLCIAIGRGQLLVPQEVRFSLLQTWFQPLVDDFGWLQRCCKSLDKKAVEEGLSQTILTLPLKQQQAILLSWFDCFSKNGGDCPNLHRAFEVWWRRTFVRPLLDSSSSAPPPQLAN